jgi:hypothetical protein
MPADEANSETSPRVVVNLARTPKAFKMFEALGERWGKNRTEQLLMMIRICHRLLEYSDEMGRITVIDPQTGQRVMLVIL